MPRFKLTVEYDGTPYVGWQAQKNGHAVQNALEAAILSMTGESIRLICAGRTDAGVHAMAQVAHVDLMRDWRPDSLRDGVNTALRQRDELVSLVDVAAVPDTFNARMGARKRHYLYRIINRRQPSPLEHRRAWHVPRDLDAEAMDVAAKRLLGHHDFTTFRASGCQSHTPMKTLEQLDVVRRGEIIEVRASARSFLHHQVRRMVGSLEMCGAGKWSADDLAAALEARDRQRSGQQAPAWGLFFTGVDYGG
ncbi:MAG: tRNA pseudouridine(38-40) synthase TruA [Beijerinckiaceae bacterium]